MAVPLTQDFDGQLSLFGSTNSSLIVSSPYNILIDNIIKGIKTFQSEVSKYRLLEDNNYDLQEVKSLLKNRLDSFIDYLIEQYHEVSLEEIVEHYEDDASEWHKLNKILLFYLKNYIYQEGLVKTLDDTRTAILESIIALDQIRFREEYYRNILDEIKRRKKARVENYIIYDANSFLNEVNELIASRGENLASYSIGPRIQELLDDINIFEDLFVSKVEIDNQKLKGILAMLFLHYLRECVYNDPRNISINRFVQNIEFFVIVNYSPEFLLSSRQREAYEVARKNVSSRIVDYVDKNSKIIFKAVKDYDLIQERKNNNKLLMIEQNEDLSDFPEPHTNDEIRGMLETFINSTFFLKLKLPMENTPIFCEDAVSARKKAMKIALLYLGRYAYKDRRSKNDELICQLEDYIHDDKEFVLDSNDMGEMFTTKADLYSRVSFRRVKIGYSDDIKRLNLTD